MSLPFAPNPLWGNDLDREKRLFSGAVAFSATAQAQCDSKPGMPSQVLRIQ